MQASRILDSFQKITNCPINIKAMDEAIAELIAFDSPCVATVARKYNVNRIVVEKGHDSIVHY